MRRHTLRCFLLLGLLSCSADTVSASSDASSDVAEEVRVAVAPTLTEAEECTATCGCAATRLEYGEAKHVAASIPIDYDDAPPVGGSHDGCWARWGAHEVPVAARNFVHNLEHGGVVFLHDCDCDTGPLEALATSLGGNVIVTPYTGLGKPFAALAWGHRLLLDCYDEAALSAFHAARQNQAPELVKAMPPGSCP